MMKTELSFTSYLALLVYVHIIALLVGAPFVLSLAGGKWLFAAGALLVFFMLTVPPAAAVHARNVRSATEKSGRITNLGSS
jgi:pilus assembly protein TadC